MIFQKRAKERDTKQGLAKLKYINIRRLRKRMKTACCTWLAECFLFKAHGFNTDMSS